MLHPYMQRILKEESHIWNAYTGMQAASTYPRVTCLSVKHVEKSEVGHARVIGSLM